MTSLTLAGTGTSLDATRFSIATSDDVETVVVLGLATSSPSVLNLSWIDYVGSVMARAAADDDDELVRAYVSRLWHEDWDSDEDAVYDTW